MISHANKRFREAFQELPPHIQHRARMAYQTFQQNPNHPSLQFKRVHPIQPIFSARVGLGYRAVGVREGDVVIWFWIGTHTDYERLLSRL